MEFGVQVCIGIQLSDIGYMEDYIDNIIGVVGWCKMVFIICFYLSENGRSVFYVMVVVVCRCQCIGIVLNGDYFDIISQVVVDLSGLLGIWLYGYYVVGINMVCCVERIIVFL